MDGKLPEQKGVTDLNTQSAASLAAFQMKKGADTPLNPTGKKTNKKEGKKKRQRDAAPTPCTRPGVNTPKVQLEDLHDTKMKAKKQVRSSQPSNMGSPKLATANLSRKHRNYGKHPREAYVRA